ncbi:glycosyl hydrolase family 18 protein [Lacinutrix chionoecetis]
MRFKVNKTVLFLILLSSIVYHNHANGLSVEFNKVNYGYGSNKINFITTINDSVKENTEEQKPSPIIDYAKNKMYKYFNAVEWFLKKPVKNKEDAGYTLTRCEELALLPKTNSVTKSVDIPEKKNKKVNITTDNEIFGFHAYFGNQQAYENYNYKILTSLSYFAYDLNPKTGKYKSIRDWKTNPVIDLAQDNNCKVFLTITNFGASNNRTFLTNEEAQQNSINIIDNLLTLRQANGVTLDFEDVPASLSLNYTNYVKNLSNRLKKNAMTLNLTLPAIDRVKAFNIEALNPYVEHFIVMGKNFYGKWGDIAGPVAPLKSGDIWKEGSIETAVNTYLDDGLPNNKLILSLPYYGSRWETLDTLIASKNAVFKDHLSYQTIKEKFPETPNYEPQSETAYLMFSEGGKNVQVWFDDVATLEKKYDFIKDKQLAGAGIWALGYGDGRSELWNALSKKFGNTKKVISADQTKPVLNTQDKWHPLLPGIEVLKNLGYILCIIFVLGFLLSLRSQAVRAVVFKNQWIKNIILLGIPLLILILFFAKKQFLYGVLVFASLLLGYIIYSGYDRTENYNKNHNRIP